MNAGRSTLRCVTLAVASALMALAGPVRAAPRQEPAAPARVAVSFKLDPRLTRSMYMGERWVSPRTYSASNSTEALGVEARAECLDGNGRAMSLSPRWTAAQPEMVSASSAQGKQVELSVRRPGESVVTVSCGEVAKQLAVSAVRRDGVWQASITQ